MKFHTTGIIIGRMNPPHIGHREIIKKSLLENSKTIVFIGTRGLRNEKNPFDFEQIKKWLHVIFHQEMEQARLCIDEIRDTSSDGEWISDLKKKLKKHNTKERVVFYGGDLINDYAITCIKEYIGEFGEYKISFKELDRNNKKLDISGQNTGISSTTLRSALKEKNKEVVDRMVDKKIVSDLLFEYNKLTQN